MSIRAAIFVPLKLMRQKQHISRRLSELRSWVPKKHPDIVMYEKYLINSFENLTYKIIITDIIDGSFCILVMNEVAF